MSGRLELICGCMFSGKTTRLIQRLAAAQASGRRVLAIKHASDDRYHDQALATHDGRLLQAVPVPDADAIPAAASEAEVIGIDEGHFFAPRLIEVVYALRDAGRTVIVVGLDHDMWGRPLPPFPTLKRRADRIDILQIPCQVCGRPGRFSQRMTPIVDGNLVGGLESYEIRCRACFQPLETNVV